MDALGSLVSTALEIASAHNTVIVIVVGVTATLFIYIYLGKQMNKIKVIRSVRMMPEENNSDEDNLKNMIQLIEEAEEILEIYDDGDAFEASIYNNKRFLDSVHTKLNRNKEFVVQCLFNFDEGLKFSQEFAEENRVQIYVRKGKRPRDDIHYKIIDKGKKAYLSSHPKGDRERRFKIVDSTHLDSEAFEKVYPVVFRNITQKLDKFAPVQQGAPVA